MKIGSKVFEGERNLPCLKNSKRASATKVNGIRMRAGENEVRGVYRRFKALLSSLPFVLVLGEDFGKI